MNTSLSERRFPLVPSVLAAFAAAAVLAGCHHGTPPAPSSANDNGTETHLIDLGGATGLALDAHGAELAGLTTVTIGRHQLQRSLQPTGQVAATDTNSADVTPRLPGRILTALVSVGDTVRRGQVIAVIDSIDAANAEAAYATAVSHLALAEHQLQQQRQLAGFGAISEQPYEDARRAYSAAQAAVAGDVAQLKLDVSTYDNTRQLVENGELTRKPLDDAHTAAAQAQSAHAAEIAALSSDLSQLALDRTVLENTHELIDNGELTRKPLDDAQNAFAAAQNAEATAEIAERSAKATLDRTENLYNSGIYSKQQFEDATTAYQSAQAATAQNKTQKQLAADELARQKTIFDKKLNASSALQPAQSKLEQDEHTYQNDRVAEASAKTALVHADEELHRQQIIFNHKLNASTALQPAQSKLQQDQHTYRNDLLTLETSRAEFARAQEVRKSGIPVNQAVQQAQDNADSARVALQGAANTLKMYGVSARQTDAQLAGGHVSVDVLAPISGVVVSRNMIVGQMADPATPLAKIVDLSQVYVDAQVFEKDLAKVSVGDSTKITVDGYPGRVFVGHIKYIGRDVSADTRTVTVRTVLDNPGGLLRPGMFADVLIGEKAGAFHLTVPAAALLQIGQKQVVYQEVAPHQYVQRVVRIGEQAGDDVPVLSGLQPGARVVTSGNALLESEQEKLQGDKGKGQ